MARDAASLRATARLLLEGWGPDAERELRRDWSAWRASNGVDDGAPEPRTAAGIKADVDGEREARTERERVEHERARAAQEAERARELAQVAARANATWETIDRELEAGVSSAYDRALRLVVDLSEALRRADRSAELDAGFERMMDEHGRRRAFERRLNEAGLLPG